MKKLIYFLFIILLSCIEKEPVIKDSLPEINLSMAYPKDQTVVEISGNLIAGQLLNEVEYGVVWAEKSDPTISDQISIISKTKTGERFTSKLNNLKASTNIYIKAFVRNNEKEVKYSNEIAVTVEPLKFWRKMGNLKIEEGQFSGVATKLDDQQLTFLRLNQNNQWEQYKHYNGSWFDADLTWKQENFSFRAISPREEPLFFTLNLNKDFTRPAAFLGGGYNLSPTRPNEKIYLNDLYWVYDTQNYLEPMPLGSGPIAHFTLNRNQYFLEENDTDKFWSYFSLEDFKRKKAFPKIGNSYDYLGISTLEKGYIIAQKLDEKEVLLFEYDDKLNEWTQKSSFTGPGRLGATVFTFKNKIYYGLGQTTNPIKGLSDIWEYDPKSDKWTFSTNYPGAGNIKVMAYDLGTYAVLFCGYQVRKSGANSEKYFNTNDTWAFVR